MGRDREKGTGRWVSRGTTGGDPVAAQRIKDALADESPQPRGQREKKAVNRNAAFVRSLLKDHAHSVIVATGGRPLHEDHEAEFVAAFKKAVAAVPARFRPGLEQVGQRMRDSISEGDRQSAWRFADEEAIKMGTALPTSWSPPEVDNSDLDAIIAAVPR